MSTTDAPPSLAPPTPVAFTETAAGPARIEDPRLSALLSAGGPGFELFRVLATKVKALGEERRLRSLGLVSATPGEGTSTLALGLAAALVQDPPSRVLLVDLALRRPALERMLGLDPEPGLPRYPDAGSQDLVPLRRVEPWGFCLLARESPAPEGREPLGLEHQSSILAAARESFDFVLLDCPPLATAADPVILQDLVDGFLLVVRARHATREAIRRSVSQLKPGKVRGVVFNDRTEILSTWLDRRRPRSGA